MAGLIYRPFRLEMQMHRQSSPNGLLFTLWTERSLWRWSTVTPAFSPSADHSDNTEAEGTQDRVVVGRGSRTIGSLCHRSSAPPPGRGL